MTDRRAVLRSISRAVRQAPDPGLPPSFGPTPASGSDASAERFVRAVGEAGGSSSIVSDADVTAEVERIARELSARTAVVTADTAPFTEAIESGLRAGGSTVVRPSGNWREAAAAADLGVTSAALGVAATGSVLLVPEGGSPRVASLLPSSHLVVLPSSRIVGGLEQALELLADLGARGSSAVLVTGPSKTADIEMIPVFGVHGPKRVHVLVVTEPDRD